MNVKALKSIMRQLLRKSTSNNQKDMKSQKFRMKRKSKFQELFSTDLFTSESWKRSRRNLTLLLKILPIIQLLMLLDLLKLIKPELKNWVISTSLIMSSHQVHILWVTLLKTSHQIGKDTTSRLRIQSSANILTLMISTREGLAHHNFCLLWAPWQRWKETSSDWSRTRKLIQMDFTMLDWTSMACGDTSLSTTSFPIQMDRIWELNRSPITKAICGLH